MKDRRATITIEHPDFTSASVVKTGKLYSGGAAVEANYLGEWLVAEDGKAQQFHGGKITVAFDTHLQNTPKKPKNVIPEGPDWGTGTIIVIVTDPPTSSPSTPITVDPPVSVDPCDPPAPASPPPAP
jgi:hypothetical protein